MVIKVDLEVWGQFVQIRGFRVLNVVLVAVNQENNHVNKQQKYKEDINERCQNYNLLLISFELE